MGACFARIYGNSDTCSERPDSIEDRPVVFIVGAPGSGKKTQGRNLENKFEFHQLSTGTLVRAELEEEESEFKDSLKPGFEAGDLVDTEILVKLLKHDMQKHLKKCKGYVITGFPRNSEQTDMFLGSVSKCSAAFYFDMTDEDLKKRLKSYKDEAAVKHMDDWLKKFREEINPLLESFNKLNIPLYKVDGSGAEQAVFEEMVTIMEEKVLKPPPVEAFEVKDGDVEKSAEATAAEDKVDAKLEPEQPKKELEKEAPVVEKSKSDEKQSSEKDQPPKKSDVKSSTAKEEALKRQSKSSGGEKKQ